MTEAAIVILGVAAPAPMLVALALDRRGRARTRLAGLLNKESAVEAPEVSAVGLDTLLLDHRMRDRLGRAGGFTVRARRRLTVLLSVAAIMPVLASVLAAWIAMHTPVAVLAAVSAGAYGSVLTLLYGLTFLEKRLEREVLFELPLFLDALILLVESGLALVPALQRLVEMRRSLGRCDAVTLVFDSIQSLSSQGVSVHDGLRSVNEHLAIAPFQHALVHLDIACNEGGKLSSSLRALGDASHQQWRLSVESRVRRLENYSVFPVFGAVVGLMALLASGPVVQLLSLDEKFARASGSAAWPAGPNHGVR